MTTLTATSLLCAVFLTPAIVTAVNAWRGDRDRLISVEEVASISPDWLAKLLLCTPCQAFWATLVAALVITCTIEARIVLCSYFPTLVSWILVQRLYRRDQGL